jgi:hypothetical protein
LPAPSQALLPVIIVALPKTTNVFVTMISTRTAVIFHSPFGSGFAGLGSKAQHLIMNSLRSIWRRQKSARRGFRRRSDS